MLESESKKRGIGILGSTGSIGTQALEVIEANPDLFQVEVLTAQQNADLLIQQAKKFKPNTVVIGDQSQYKKVEAELWPEGIKTYTGKEALVDIVQQEDIDVVLTALVGYAGLLPTISAIKAKKTIALANKETLVVAGQLITQLANQYQVPILPVDSEHSAIFQCLLGEFHNKIEKIILTASGGPFLGKTSKDLEAVTRKEALKHPNWEMGAKITIDSASLMNKGLEVIEAKWLFDLKSDQIEVIVHPQSILHSIVQFEDGSMKAQMGLPDMKLPIQFALAYPNRIASNFPRFDFINYPNLSFLPPDKATFINLELAYQAIKMGGTAACALNAANEISNAAFLEEKIGFLSIGLVNQKVLASCSHKKVASLEDLIACDEEARLLAKECIEKSQF